MKRILRSIPAALAALALAAHFYRSGSLALTAACLVGMVLVFVRAPWAILVARSGLTTGVIIWAHTAWRIAHARMAEGRPHTRMLVILGAVALFTAFAAWLLPRGEER